ncbi:MAG: hypothetical protein JST84_26295 [Acidobacteria bacterium]|nr:hypothetical protein [Acidobacteriota bacterium]
MLSLKATFICCLFGFILFGLAQQTPRPVTLPSVPGTADDPNPMQAILREVKQIRASIPRSNLYSFNAEITMNRLRLQVESVKALTTRIEETKASIKKLSEDSEEQRLIRKTLEERLQRTIDPIQRAGLEYAIEQLKLKVNNAFQSIQDLRAQEYRLTNQIQLEQSRVDELNNRLDALQRELESQAQKEAR